MTKPGVSPPVSRKGMRIWCIHMGVKPFRQGTEDCKVGVKAIGVKLRAIIILLLIC